MTCKDAIAKLAEYLDAELTPDVLAEFEAHLRECEPCRAYLATYRKTKELVAKIYRVEMPEALKRHLRELLVSQGRRTS